MRVHITHRGRLLRHYPLGGYNCRMGTVWEIDIPRHGLEFQFHCSVLGQVGKPHTFHSSNWVLSGYRREKILHFAHVVSRCKLILGNVIWWLSSSGREVWKCNRACFLDSERCLHDGHWEHVFLEHVISSKGSLAYCWRHSSSSFSSLLSLGICIWDWVVWGLVFLKSDWLRIFPQISRLKS